MKLTYIFRNVIRIVGQVVSDIMKDHIAFIFRIKQFSSLIKVPQSFKTLWTTNKTTCHIPEDVILAVKMSNLILQNKSCTHKSIWITCWHKYLSISDVLVWRSLLLHMIHSPE